MKLEAAYGSSVALFHCSLELKDQSRTVGVARQQLHFLCRDKERKQKKALGTSYLSVTMSFTST